MIVLLLMQGCSFSAETWQEKGQKSGSVLQEVAFTIVLRWQGPVGETRHVYGLQVLDMVAAGLALQLQL